MSLELIHARWQATPDNDSLSVLNQLRGFRNAESSLREVYRMRLRLGTRDVEALRMLLTAAEEEKTVSPTELSHLLGISSASTTNLIRRLEDAGFAERAPHPHDGRGQHIRATATARARIQPNLEHVCDALIEIAEQFSHDELATVSRFLDGVTQAFETNR